LTGCGGSEPSVGGGTERPSGQSKPAANAGSDPCALVTPAEASEALGATVGEPERPAAGNIPPMLTSCNYIAPKGQGVAVLTLLVRRSGGAAEARSGFESTRTGMPETQDVPGVGEQAFWMAGANQLHVLAGSTHLIIGGAELDKARTVAAAAVQRLPS
jgi:hypothetical protein